jgi:hypothetical protein
VKPDNALTKGLPQDCNERKNPLPSLIYFASEREAIRLQKEAGLPQPWTDDKILREGKFTNIKREYDRVSRFIFQWAEPVIPHAETLLFNLLFARHCNRVETLERVGPVLPDDDPEENIAKIRACEPKYATPYLCPTHYLNLGFKTREDWIFRFFPTVAQATAAALSREKSIHETVKGMDRVWGFRNWFASTQALLDFSYLRPDLVDPASEVYVGPGAAPSLRLLGKTIPQLLQIREIKELCEVFAGVEHTLCEWDKYLEFKYGMRPMSGRFLYRSHEAK